MTIAEEIQALQCEAEELRTLAALRDEITQLRNSLGIYAEVPAKKCPNIVSDIIRPLAEAERTLTEDPLLGHIRNMGSAYFVSRAYNELVEDEMSWQKAGSQALRNATYMKLTREDKIRGAQMVMGMSAVRLNSNRIGLPGQRIIAMAAEVAKQ